MAAKARRGENTGKYENGRTTRARGIEELGPILTEHVYDTFKRLGTSPLGLGSDRAAALLETVGPNEVARRKRAGRLIAILSLFSNPLVLILLVAGLISGLLGDVSSTVIIFSIVLLSTFLMSYVEVRAERAVEALRQRISTTATVLRDGNRKEVPLSQLVPGDIIRLSAGDIVPADARVVGAKEFFIDQSALTGESFPVEKHGVRLNKHELEDITSWRNFLFMGTSVVSGSARAVVIRTGSGTEYGKIVSKTLEKRSETEFERGLRRLGTLLMEITFLLVIFVFFVLAFLRHGNRQILDSLLFAVALAVGLTPELLPMILTLNLAKGGIAMSKKGVIVRHLPAIQNFGTMDVLCTDKTGTLTENRVSMEMSVDAEGNESERVLFHAFINSYYQTGLRSPLDEAILAKKHFEVKTFQKIDEIPFDFVRRRVSVVVDTGGRFIFTKGATEEVLKVCTGYEKDGVRMELDEDAHRAIAARYVEMSSLGIRVLAVAYRKADPLRTSFSAVDETEMVFLGYLGFRDPPKESSRQALDGLRCSGVELKIITGDNELVTQDVCEKLGFRIRKVVLGSQLSEMHDDALSRVVEEANIFTRVTPAQKNRIILALRGNGHVVGYLGDGINDAPSRRAADVSISVDNAVDVAKETADIVLSRNDLRVLNEGVLEGRKTYANTMKYVQMAVSSNFGNMFSAAGASLFLPFLPMLPVQILLNNLLYDMSELSIPTDNVDPEYLEAPKRLDIDYIRRFMLYFGAMSSVFDFLTFAVLLFVFQAQAGLFQTGWFIESLCTQTAVIFVIRTRVVPFYHSKASRLLTAVSIAIIVFALLIPFLPLAPYFKFVVPPPSYYLFLAAFVGAYLMLVEGMKHFFYRKYSHRLARCA